MHAYLDDFPVAQASYGTTAGSQDFQDARKRIAELTARMGLQPYTEKGEWIGATCVENLGVMIDSEAMKFYVVPRKAEKFVSSASPC